MKHLARAAVLLLFVLPGFVSAQNRDEPSAVACKNDPHIIAACFQIRGRLSWWNGTPSLRLWNMRSSRILGVRTETAPHNVAKLWNDNRWDTEVYGDFTVCPFTIEKPGHMQMVCIESASHLVAKTR